MSRKRRTQAERRETTQASLLKAARELFGEQGYADTSLEDIAEACNVTVRPIYHYYKSKLGLFTAVTEQIEAEIIESIKHRETAKVQDIWTGFMKNCEDPQFRQIILIDGPVLLGRRRMTQGPITQAATRRMSRLFKNPPDRLILSMLLGSLSQAAIHIAENGARPTDYARIRELIDSYVKLMR